MHTSIHIMHCSGIRCTHQFDCVQSILQTRAYSVRLESFVPGAQIRMIFSILNEYICMICHSSTWEQFSVQYTSTRFLSKSSTGVQMQVKHRSTDASRVQEYRCHVNWAVSTNVPAEVHTQRQPSITLSKSNAHWRGITKYEALYREVIVRYCCCKVKISFFKGISNFRTLYPNIYHHVPSQNPLER